MVTRPQHALLTGTLRPSFKVVKDRRTGQKFTQLPGLMRKYRYRDVSAWQYLEHRRDSLGNLKQVVILQSQNWQGFMENCNPCWRAPTQNDISVINLRLRSLNYMEKPKFCVDCVHSTRVEVERFVCSNPMYQIRDLVTGKQGNRPDCELLRYSDADQRCGHDAKGFKPAGIHDPLGDE